MIAIRSGTRATEAIQQEFATEIKFILERYDIYITGEQAQYAAMAALLVVEMAGNCAEDD